MSSGNSHGVLLSLEELLVEMEEMERKVNDLNQAAIREKIGKSSWILASSISIFMVLVLVNCEILYEILNGKSEFHQPSIVNVKRSIRWGLQLVQKPYYFPQTFIFTFQFQFCPPKSYLCLLSQYFVLIVTRGQARNSVDN